MGIDEIEQSLNLLSEWESNGWPTADLLEVRTCSAGLDNPAEMHAGRLFISDQCFLFESLMPSSFHIGPVAWKNVRKLQRQHGEDLTLEVRDGNQYILSGLSDVDLLEQLSHTQAVQSSDIVVHCEQQSMPTDAERVEHRRSVVRW